MLEKLLGLPLNASAHGGEIDRLILYIHILMVALFVGWILFFGYLLVRYRRGAHPKADYDGVKSHASSYLEGVVAVLEIALLVGISIPIWAKKVSAFPPENEAVRVRVIGQQFAWNIHYPGPDGKFGRTDIALVNEQTNPIGLDRSDPAAKDDVVTLNQLYLPVNKPIICEISTKDVIHSFFLPVLRVKQDTVPGMLIPVHFMATMTTDEMREQMAQTIRLPSAQPLPANRYVSMDELKDKDGNVIVKKGGLLSTPTLQKLADAGLKQISIGPARPSEIACAQLCGLGHYRMVGNMTILTQDKFQKWYDEEVQSAKEE